MTLVAFTAAYGTHAEFITDDASYTVSGSRFGRCTKHLLLPHLDAAVITQGEGDFGLAAKATLLHLSNEADDFDTLAGLVAEWLPQVWDGIEQPPLDYEGNRTASTVFLLGYSPAASGFVAHGYASETGFQRFAITGTWCMPMPWNLQVSQLELDRLLDSPDITDDAKTQLRDTWPRRQALPAPADLEEWEHLARTVRQQRALESFGKVFVAGTVHHTRLERGSSSTRTLLAYADHGDEFNRLVAGTHHPQAQLAPCHCGSGFRFIDCHLAPYLDDPCACGSGMNMRGCCAIDRL